MPIFGYNIYMAIETKDILKCCNQSSFWINFRLIDWVTLDIFNVYVPCVFAIIFLVYSRAPDDVPLPFFFFSKGFISLPCSCWSLHWSLMSTPKKSAAKCQQDQYSFVLVRPVCDTKIFTVKKIFTKRISDFFFHAQNRTLMVLLAPNRSKRRKNAKLAPNLFGCCSFRF